MQEAICGRRLVAYNFVGFADTHVHIACDGKLKLMLDNGRLFALSADP